MNNSRNFAPLKLRCALLIAAATLAAAAASASAAQPTIEGVWSFSGGTVIIAPDSSGNLVGTVASPTTFGDCPHPVGQAMWTGLQPTGDGSYSGYHQWYHTSADGCGPIPVLGPTAFRVLTLADNSTELKVCFNEPGSSGPPSIAADGTASNVNYGCTASAPVSGVPTYVPTFADAITLPPATDPAGKQNGAKACFSRRDFLIHIREPKNDPFVRLTVYLGHRVFKVYRHGQQITAVINLRKLPRGTYTVTIRATTAAGYHVKGSRRYRTCVPKPRKA
jgi:hypothetical protein